MAYQFPMEIRPGLVSLRTWLQSRLRSSRGWRTPAISALIIQLVAAAVTYLLSLFWFDWTAMQFSLAHAALTQGLSAAILTWITGLARWWILIALFFPGAVLMTYALQLPPAIFALAFMFLLGLYWSTFRTQVPFYPSGLTAWQAVLALLPRERSIRMIDIGSGLGGLVLHLSAQRPESVFLGIELAPLPWLVSRLRTLFIGSKAQFIRGDYERLNFAQFDIVFAYLSPAAMPALWQKAQREMLPGSLLLSYEFPIIGQVPDLIVLPDPHGPHLYGWRR